MGIRKPHIQNNCLQCGELMPVNLKMRPSVANRRKFCGSTCYLKRRHAERIAAGIAAPSGWERQKGYNRPFLLERAIEKYTKNPKLCKGCGIPIPLVPGVRPCDLWNKGYCSRECSNSKRKSLEFFEGGIIPNTRCITTSLFEERRNMNAQAIRSHAKKVYRSYTQEWKCEYCGAELQYPPQVAHIKAISSFPETETLLMINQLSNLIGICPNDHLAFDNGFITEAQIREKVAARKPRP